MKNIQVIDGASNCTFSIFQATDREFALLFAAGQDIQFAEDLPHGKVKDALARLWQRPIRKTEAQGIHGTLFFGLPRYRAVFPDKREDSAISSAINAAQRRLFARGR